MTINKPWKAPKDCGAKLKGLTPCFLVEGHPGKHMSHKIEDAQKAVETIIEWREF